MVGPDLIWKEKLRSIDLKDEFNQAILKEWVDIQRWWHFQKVMPWRDMIDTRVPGGWRNGVGHGWVREWGWKGTEDSKKSLIFFSAGIWLYSNWAACFKDQQEAASALQEPESVANSQGPNLCQINKRIIWDLGDGPQWYSELIQNCWLMKERSSFFHVCDFNCDIQLACKQASNA